LIAAAAICHELVLVSRDRHFRKVEGLTVVSW
jgi:predicted nucleic acid-binding protein